MATFQITGPDGKKYRVSGENAEGALQALQSHLGTAQDGNQPSPQAAPQARSEQSQFQKPTGLSDMIVNGVSAGLVSKAGDALVAGVRAPFTDKSFGEEYDAIRQQSLQGMDQYRQENPKLAAAGEIGGSIAGAGKLMSGGATFNRFIPQAASGVKRLLGLGAAGAADGLALNTVTNFGNERDLSQNAGLAAFLGAAAPAIGAGLSKGVDLGKAAFGMGNEPRTKKAILEAFMRSGKTEADIAADMTQAASDGQGVYNLADALGNSGQRMLSGVARSPGDMRQTIAETLISRQSGQGDRLTNALVEGFDAPKTADQMTKALTKQRGDTAARNYEMARYGLTPDDFQNAVVPKGSFRGYLETLPKPRVNVDEVVAAIDERIGPMQGSGVAGDSIDTALQGFRSRLAVPKEKLPDGTFSKTLSDFDRVLGVKKDLRDAIEVAKRQGQGNRARELEKVHSVLDSALESASPAYRTANDTFAKQSKTIEAVDTGATAASGRVRSQDSIPQFQSLSPEEQAAFRTGYVDPLISRVQSTASGPATNKVRSLISDKTAQEFPAFAAQGKGDQLGRRLAREKTMFETANKALGGSQTADNLQDLAEIGGIDPSVVMNVLGGNWKQAALAGITKAGNAVKGRNSATRDMIAKALLSTGAEAPKQIVQAIQAGKQLTAKQQMIAKMLLGAAIPMLPAN